MDATQQYHAVLTHTFPRHYAVADERNRVVDYFQTRSAAEYAARLLSNQLATVAPHAIIGCRVMVTR